MLCGREIEPTENKSLWDEGLDFYKQLPSSSELLLSAQKSVNHSVMFAYYPHGNVFRGETFHTIIKPVLTLHSSIY